MKKLTNKQRQKELGAIAAMSDDQIDLSDIPELIDEQLSRAIRGEMYRSIKRPVTMRLDADVIAWLKRDGPGYQTKANALLRQHMIRSYQDRKGPDRASGSRGSTKHAPKKRAR
jgi:uncharacterized protein (DUF4415 family)